MSGYFNDREAMVRAVAANDNDTDVEGIYWCLNPFMPELLARSDNKLIKADKTTKDTDVTVRCWLPIDLDPVRPAGISSTNAEHEAAIKKAMLINEFLRNQGWPEMIIADSGNGGHMLPFVDLPNNKDSDELVKNVLLALDGMFSDATVKVDRSTFNAARIFKVYGTMARKGSNMPERPHRRASVIQAPEKLMPVPIELLRNLVAMYKGSQTSKETTEKPVTYTSGNIDGNVWMAKWLSDHGLEYTVKQDGDMYIYNLRECPFNPEHKGTESAIIVRPQGFGFNCFHDSCQDKQWKDVRALYEPEYSKSKANKQGTDNHGNDPPDRYFDITIARNMMAMFGDRILPDVTSASHWYAYIDRTKTWQRQSADAARMYATKTLEKLISETEHSSLDDKVMKVLADNLNRFNTADKINAICSRYRALENVEPVDDTAFDPDPYLLNVRNGVIDLRTGELKPHTPSFRMTMMANVAYDPAASCPEFLCMLNDIFLGDQQKSRTSSGGWDTASQGRTRSGTSTTGMARQRATENPHSKTSCRTCWAAMRWKSTRTFSGNPRMVGDKPTPQLLTSGKAVSVY